MCKHSVEHCSAANWLPLVESHSTLERISPISVQLFPDHKASDLTREQISPFSCAHWNAASPAIKGEWKGSNSIRLELGRTPFWHLINKGKMYFINFFPVLDSWDLLVCSCSI